MPYPTIGTNDDLIGRTLPTSTIISLDGMRMSTLAAAHRQYGDSIRFVGLNMNDSATVARAFAEKCGVTYELFTEPSGVFVTALGIDAHISEALPT